MSETTYDYIPKGTGPVIATPSTNVRIVEDEDFHVFTPQGERIDIRLGTYGPLDGWPDRQGRIHVRLPKPFDGMTVRRGEVMGHGRWLMVRKALAALNVLPTTEN
jgi:hypothetical protein